MTRTPRSFAALVAIGALSLSACASGPSEPVNEFGDAQIEEDPVETPTLTATPTPTPDPVASALLTHSWSDEDGYTFNTIVAQPEITAVKDVANAKPGEVVINFSWAAAATTTNTTPERNAPSQGLDLMPIWDHASAICQSRPQGMAPGSIYGASTDPGCTVGVIPARNLSSAQGQIAPGASVELANDMVPLPFAVPEELADAALAELLAPKGWALFVTRPAEKPLGDCNNASGVPVQVTTFGLSC